MGKSGYKLAHLVPVEAKSLDNKLYSNKIDKILKMRLICYFLNIKMDSMKLKPLLMKIAGKTYLIYYLLITQCQSGKFLGNSYKVIYRKYHFQFLYASHSGLYKKAVSF